MADLAARIDDVLNALPARLTALTYALLGNTRRALACWRLQAPALGLSQAGAGALGVALGGGALYHGQWEERPPLGEGPAPDAGSIRAAIALVRRGALLWLAVATSVALILHFTGLPHA